MFGSALAFSKHLTKSVKPAVAAAISGVSGRPILTGAPAYKIEAIGPIVIHKLKHSFSYKASTCAHPRMTNQICPVPMQGLCRESIITTLIGQVIAP